MPKRGPPERVVTELELNRAMLARQLLLDRLKLPIPRVVERMAGIQAQYAPSSYIGLWSRMRDFRRDDLTRALERKTVVQGTLMRSTIHIVSREDYWPIADAIREDRRAWLLRVRKDLDTRRMHTLARRLGTLLAGGPQRANDIAKAFDLDAGAFNGVGLWLDLVRVPPSGTWERRRADLYDTAQNWLGDQGRADRDLGLELLVRRYLGGFGPAPVKDIADWAGLTISTIKPTVERLELRRFRDERGRVLVDLPRAPLPGADAPAPVRFIPTWDATLLVHARRTQILPERFRALVFNTKTPHSLNTFLVDGRVAGSWAIETGRVQPQPFEPLPLAARRELDEEAGRLSAFIS